MRTSSNRPHWFLKSILTLTAGLSTLSALPRDANAEAKWTFVTILSGRYEDMKSRLDDTGSSDDVNVLALHANGETMTAYRVLKDPNASQHPPGQCCPDDSKACCPTEDIDLPSLGITGPSVDATVVEKFLTFVQAQYPAQHYVISLRGHSFYTYMLPSVGPAPGNGFSVVQLAELIQNFTRRRGNKNLEVLNLGFCTGSTMEWAYPLAPNVDYMVASPNFTSSPVSIRWRNYRWSRELIKNPDIASLDLAQKMVEIFSETTKSCIQSNNGCSNASMGQPWSAAALDMARIPDLADAVRAMTCSLIASTDKTVFAQARDASTCYGTSTVLCQGKAGNRDLKHFGLNLQTHNLNTETRSAVDGMLAAHAKVVKKVIFEPGSYNDQAYGLGGYFDYALANPKELGTYQGDSVWKLLLQASESEGLPAPSGIAIQPARVKMWVGDSVALSTRSVIPNFGPACPTSASWSLDNNNVGTLSMSEGASSVFQASQPGELVVRANSQGMAAEAVVQVYPAGADIPPDEQPPLGQDDQVGRAGQAPAGSADPSVTPQEASPNALNDIAMRFRVAGGGCSCEMKAASGRHGAPLSSWAWVLATVLTAIRRRRS